MATHCGQDGVVKVGDVNVAEVRSWSLSTMVETVDASTLGDAWKIHQATQKSWHGSLSCFWDENDGGQGRLTLGESVTLQLYVEHDTPPAFSGTALITGVDYTGSHNGLVEASVAFQGSGALDIPKGRVKSPVQIVKEQLA